MKRLWMRLQNFLKNTAMEVRYFFSMESAIKYLQRPAGWLSNDWIKRNRGI